MMTASTTNWDDRSIDPELTPTQLQTIATDLDAIAISLVALTQIGATEIGQAARQLKLEPLVSTWVSSWPARPTVSSQPLDLERLRALVSIVSHLAKEHQPIVRRNVRYWEQTIEYHQLPLQSPSLADYIDSFIIIYQNRAPTPPGLSLEKLTDAALALLVELLFYGSPNGHLRLWESLFKRSQVPMLPRA